SIKPPCAAASVPTVSAPNYFYLCNTAYDSLTNQMEFAPCLSVTGDPVVGSTSNISTDTCPGSGGKLSAIGPVVQAADSCGKGAYTIEYCPTNEQFGYLNNN